MTDSRTVSVTTASAPPDAIDPIVTDVSDRRRFEIGVDGAVVGFAEYRRRPGVILFTHTEIDAARNGEGLGTKLVRGALDSARAEGLAVLPYCPFVRDFIKRHPEYLNLVPEQRREQFALTAAEVPSRSQFRHPVTVPPIPSKTVEQARGITMADSKQGNYDPKKGGKFAPTTKAKPPPPPRPGGNKNK